MDDTGHILPFPPLVSPEAKAAAARLHAECDKAEIIARGVISSSLVMMDVITGHPGLSRRTLVKVALRALAELDGIDLAESYVHGVAAYDRLKAATPPEAG